MQHLIDSSLYIIYYREVIKKSGIKIYLNAWNLILHLKILL